MAIVIREARETDQGAIKAIVRSARINPTGLEWSAFLVAEENGRVVGVGQVKAHKDGSHELASIAVVPERKRQGIGGCIITALLARENGPLYLMCTDDLEGYYTRFQFRRIKASDLPRSMYIGFTMGRRIIPILALLVRRKIRLTAMKREATSIESNIPSVTQISRTRWNGRC